MTRWTCTRDEIVDNNDMEADWPDKVNIGEQCRQSWQENWYLLTKFQQMWNERLGPIDLAKHRI